MTPNNNGEKSPRILIVDDEADIRSIFARGLQKEGFEVDSTGDPVQVLQGYSPGSYDLLLLDIRMPKMTGFELYREIRKIDPRVKVCFITAFEIYYDEFRRVFPKINVSCFVRKPVTIAELAAAVRIELARRQVEDEPAATQFHKRPT